MEVKQVTCWLAAISCEFDDYVIIEACFSDTEDMLINAIYETYYPSYDDMEMWSISVMPCPDTEMFCSTIIPLSEVTKKERDRVYALFKKKLAMRHPGHPWIKE